VAAIGNFMLIVVLEKIEGEVVNKKDCFCKL
jgi:hypothetical protein